MLNITICSLNDEEERNNISLINKVLVNYDVDYRIHKFSGLNENDNGGFNIYILNIDKLGFSNALKIREQSIDCIIVLVSDCYERIDDIIHSKLMVFDFITKSSDYNERFIDVLKAAIDVYCRMIVFTFRYKHVIYRIPYKDINYIEKEPLIKRCIIHTKSNDYYIVSSIDHLIELLGIDFIRTHQSCIVNVNNIKRINLDSNEIVFRNNMKTNLLTDKVKKEIKKIY